VKVDYFKHKKDKIFVHDSVPYHHLPVKDASLTISKK